MAKRIPEKEKKLRLVQTSPRIKEAKIGRPPDTEGHGLSEKKFNRGAPRVWNKVRPHKAPKSKGSTDVASDKPSTRVGRGKGYDGSAGYVVGNGNPGKGYTKVG